MSYTAIAQSPEANRVLVMGESQKHIRSCFPNPSLPANSVQLPHERSFSGVLIRITLSFVVAGRALWINQCIILDSLQHQWQSEWLWLLEKDIIDGIFLSPAANRGAAADYAFGSDCVSAFNRFCKFWAGRFQPPRM